MKNQILRKQFTMNYLFVFIGIIFLLSYSNPCFAQKKNTAEEYKTYIKQADKALAASDYKKALELYEKANQVMPEYNYPTNKISEIKKILESGAAPNTHSSPKTMSSNSSYKSLLAQAEYANDNKDYATALLLYEKAYRTKPDYSYAPEKIDEINTILNSAPETKTRIFESTMLKAESLYEQKNYQQAKSEFEKASLVDSSAQLPKDRLIQISSVYIDTDEMGNFNLAVANGDKELAISDFNHAILFYEAALKIHPNAKFVTKKITDTKNQQTAYIAQNQTATTVSADKPLQSETPTKTTKLKEVPETDKTVKSQVQSELEKYNAALAGAESSLKSADYEAALLGFKSALAIKPSEKYPQIKITEIENLLTEKAAQKESNENYRKSIAEADIQFNESKFEDAISTYTKALGFKPTESYPQQKITEAQSKLALLKNKEESYAAAIASGNQFLSASKYPEALSAYKQALSIKPNEAYPADKTAEINALLAKQKSDSDNYAQAIRTGEKALVAGNYSLALTSFQDAQKTKPSESYPMEQITEIKAQIAAQQDKNDRYSKVLKSGDLSFANKQYSGALAAYTEAAELKKNEKYPQDQIVKINKIIADSRSVDDNYTLAVTEADKLFGMKDYSGAISAFSKASEIKPSETYPIQRIDEINKIVRETTLARSSEYNKALEVADKLYSTKVFDQAIEAYETAAKINPGDAYPELQISKIRKYMSDHAILDLYSQTLVISEGNEKKFSFSAIDPGLRKNNYILLKARSTGKSIPKVYLNYGKDNQKNGGIVLRRLDKSVISDFLISISIQDKWFREDNNWISLSVETGNIEITEVQIAAGE